MSFLLARLLKQIRFYHARHLSETFQLWQYIIEVENIPFPTFSVSPTAQIIGFMMMYMISDHARHYSKKDFFRIFVQ